MQNPLIHCPRCNSLEKFGNQIREVGEGQVEVFIRCTTCNWEDVIMRDFPDKIRNNVEIEKLKIRAAREPQLKDVIRRKMNKNDRK
jgi:hypothetical protein